MRILVLCLAVVFGLGVLGCSKNPEENETTPVSKLPDATAADNMKKINGNPNLPDNVKKVLGSAGR
jgi:hypothetical protein